MLAVLAIIPLAALLSHATESVAETGDAVSGLLNATLGNLTELIIALAALQAGEYMLVKASIAGAIVTNSLFMLGASFLLGGLLLPHSGIQSRRRKAACGAAADGHDCPDHAGGGRRISISPQGASVTQKLSTGLAILLIVAYGLSLVFSLKTHKDLFVSKDHGEKEAETLPISVAVGTLIVVTVLVALVSEIFVGSVQKAGETLGFSPAFIGFIVVALVGGAAEMAVAFSAARKNRLDMSVGIALGSASQIALFVAPVLVLLSYVIGPQPMDLHFWPGAVSMVMIATITACFITNSGRSAWFIGALLLFIYLIFAMTLYVVPPGTHVAGSAIRREKP